MSSKRPKSLPPEKGKNINVQGQIFLQLVPPSSSPALQSLAWSSGRSAPTSLVPTLESHTVTLTQRPKVMRKLKPQKERERQVSKELSFPNQNMAPGGQRTWPQVSVPLFHPIPSTIASSDGEGIFGLGASFGRWVKGTMRKGTKITEAPPSDWGRMQRRGRFCLRI